MHFSSQHDAPGDPAQRRQILSAAADGDANAAMLQQAAQWWRDDEQARQTWHAYHLIGDVMRSDELAGTPKRDAAFLTRLRQRLDTEPVPLFPAAGGVGARRGLAWFAPAAVAAGFMAVAAVVLVVRMNEGSAGAPALAQSAQPAQSAQAGLAGATGAVTTLAGSRASNAQTFAPHTDAVREAQLERYLRAHRAYGGASPTQLPGGVLRGVETVSLDR